MFLFARLNGAVRCVYQEHDSLGSYVDDYVKFRIEQGEVGGNNTYWFMEWDPPPDGNWLDLGHCKGDNNFGEYLVRTARGKGDTSSMRDVYDNLRFQPSNGSWLDWPLFGCDYDQTPSWRHFTGLPNDGEIDSGSNSCDFQGGGGGG